MPVFGGSVFQMSVKLIDRYVQGFVAEDELSKISHIAEASFGLVRNGTGAGSDFLKWLDLPVNYDREEFTRIKKTAKKIQKSCDVFVVIGIGGSYLGTRAAIEFIRSPLYNSLPKETPDIYFAGNSVSPSALSDVLRVCYC